MLRRVLTIAGALTAGFVLASCQGVIGATDPNDGPPGTRCGRSVCGADAELASATAFPRLTHAQWENTMRDVLRLDNTPGLSGAFEPDTSVSLFDNNGRTLRVSQDLWGDYQQAAETLAAQVTTDPSALQRVLPADLPPSGAERTRAFVADVGRRAYRRPLTEAEVATHVALFNEGPSHFPEMSGFDAGVRITLEAMLQSPYLVYRIELGSNPAADEVTLTDFEIATRLAYTLWNTTPDDELLNAAEQGQLSTGPEIATQAQRMLMDPRGASVVERFHSQLLNWSLYRGIQKDPAEFPEAYPGLGNDLYEEARRFTNAVVLDDAGSLEALLTARYSYVNEALAGIYGIQGVTGDFQRVTFSPSDERGGLLTQLGFLATNAGPTGAIHRGVYVNHRILCSELPPPPDDLPPLPPDTGAEKTTRERIEEHTGEGTCGSTCHGTYINPVGFAFENFDGLGRFRTEEAGLPVDAFATFEFDSGEVSYDGAVEFAGTISEEIQTHDCYASHLLEFALGRDIVGGDLDYIQQLGDASIAGSSIQDLIISLVSSDAFRARHNAQEDAS